MFSSLIFKLHKFAWIFVFRRFTSKYTILTQIDLYYFKMLQCLCPWCRSITKFIIIYCWIHQSDFIAIHHIIPHRYLFPALVFAFMQLACTFYSEYIECIWEILFTLQLEIWLITFFNRSKITFSSQFSNILTLYRWDLSGND